MVLDYFRSKIKRAGNVLTSWRMLVNYLFVLPALLVFLVFGLYPFLKIFQLSLYEWDGLRPEMTFMGLQNFVSIITDDPEWWNAIGHAAWITFLSLTIQNFVALVLALICAKGIRGSDLFRIIYFIPPVLSGIVTGLMWNWIFKPDGGFFNNLLGLLGLQKYATAWFANPKTALNTVAFVHMWKGFGWGFVVLLAGLLNIPQQLYEAARVDGANAWHRFWNITVPMMMPVFFLVIIMTILGSMQIFDIIVATTNAGPAGMTEVPVTRILASMGAQHRFGYASAQGIVFGIILLICSFSILKISNRVKQTY